jgi:hypothetical protein
MQCVYISLLQVSVRSVGNVPPVVQIKAILIGRRQDSIGDCLCFGRPTGRESNQNRNQIVAFVTDSTLCSEYGTFKRNYRIKADSKWFGERDGILSSSERRIDSKVRRRLSEL